jgi:hypothetical protein
MKSRRVDTPSEKRTTKGHPTPRQIVGLSLKPERAREFKSEAARRGIPVNKLFEEMWTLYKSTPES